MTIGEITKSVLFIFLTFNLNAQGILNPSNSDYEVNIYKNGVWIHHNILKKGERLQFKCDINDDISIEFRRINDICDNDNTYMSTLSIDNPNPKNNQIELVSSKTMIRFNHVIFIEYGYMGMVKYGIIYTLPLNICTGA